MVCQKTNPFCLKLEIDKGQVKSAMEKGHFQFGEFLALKGLMDVPAIF